MYVNNTIVLKHKYDSTSLSREGQDKNKQKYETKIGVQSKDHF